MGVAIEVAVTEARAEFSELINRVGYGGEQVVITRHGKPLVALVPARQVVEESSEQESGNVTVLDLGSRTGDMGIPNGIAAQHTPDTKNSERP